MINHYYFLQLVLLEYLSHTDTLPAWKLPQHPQIRSVESRAVYLPYSGLIYLFFCFILSIKRERRENIVLKSLQRPEVPHSVQTHLLKLLLTSPTGNAEEKSMRENRTGSPLFPNALSFFLAISSYRFELYQCCHVIFVFVLMHFSGNRNCSDPFCKSHVPCKEQRFGLAQMTAIRGLSAERSDPVFVNINQQ